jgi:nitroreductase
VQGTARRACGRTKASFRHPFFSSGSPIWRAPNAWPGFAGRPHDGRHFLETFLVSAIDAALAAQNAVVAMEPLGLGAVYIGAIRNRPDAAAAEPGLAPHVAPVFGLCIGYADPDTPAAVKPRLPQNVVVHRETYALETRDDGLAAYDEILRQFQVSQGLPTRLRGS